MVAISKNNNRTQNYKTKYKKKYKKKQYSIQNGGKIASPKLRNSKKTPKYHTKPPSNSLARKASRVATGLLAGTSKVIFGSVSAAARKISQQPYHIIRNIHQKRMAKNTRNAAFKALGINSRTRIFGEDTNYEKIKKAQEAHVKATKSFENQRNTIERSKNNNTIKKGKIQELIDKKTDTKKAFETAITDFHNAANTKNPVLTMALKKNPSLITNLTKTKSSKEFNKMFLNTVKNSYDTTQKELSALEGARKAKEEDSDRETDSTKKAILNNEVKRISNDILGIKGALNDAKGQTFIKAKADYEERIAKQNKTTLKLQGQEWGFKKMRKSISKAYKNGTVNQMAFAKIPLNSLGLSGAFKRIRSAGNISTRSTEQLMADRQKNLGKANSIANKISTTKTLHDKNYSNITKYINANLSKYSYIQATNINLFSENYNKLNKSLTDRTSAQEKITETNRSLKSDPNNLVLLDTLKTETEKFDKATADYTSKQIEIKSSKEELPSEIKSQFQDLIDNSEKIFNLNYERARILKNSDEYEGDILTRRGKDVNRKFDAALTSIDTDLTNLGFVGGLDKDTDTLLKTEPKTKADIDKLKSAIDADIKDYSNILVAGNISNKTRIGYLKLIDLLNYKRNKTLHNELDTKYTEATTKITNAITFNSKNIINTTTSKSNATTKAKEYETKTKIATLQTSLDALNKIADNDKTPQDFLDIIKHRKDIQELNDASAAITLKYAPLELNKLNDVKGKLDDIKKDLTFNKENHDKKILFLKNNIKLFNTTLTDTHDTHYAKLIENNENLSKNNMEFFTETTKQEANLNQPNKDKITAANALIATEQTAIDKQQTTITDEEGKIIANNKIINNPATSVSDADKDAAKARNIIAYKTIETASSIINTSNINNKKHFDTIIDIFNSDTQIDTSNKTAIVTKLTNLKLGNITITNVHNDINDKKNTTISKIEKAITAMEDSISKEDAAKILVENNIRMADASINTNKAAIETASGTIKSATIHTNTHIAHQLLKLTDAEDKLDTHIDQQIKLYATVPTPKTLYFTKKQFSKMKPVEVEEYKQKLNTAIQASTTSSTDKKGLVSILTAITQKDTLIEETNKITTANPTYTDHEAFYKTEAHKLVAGNTITEARQLQNKIFAESMNLGVGNVVLKELVQKTANTLIHNQADIADKKRLLDNELADISKDPEKLNLTPDDINNSGSLKTAIAAAINRLTVGTAAAPTPVANAASLKILLANPALLDTERNAIIAEIKKLPQYASSPIVNIINNAKLHLDGLDKVATATKDIETPNINGKPDGDITLITSVDKLVTLAKKNFDTTLPVPPPAPFVAPPALVGVHGLPPAVHGLPPAVLVDPALVGVPPALVGVVPAPFVAPPGLVLAAPADPGLVLAAPADPGLVLAAPPDPADAG